MTSNSDQSSTQETLRCDPTLEWDGPHPYKVMRRFGLGPGSSTQDVLDASFEMESDTPLAEAENRAWELLRIPAKRALIDFFCYVLPAPAAAPKPSEPERESPTPIPWQLLDRLAHDLPDEVMEPGAAGMESVDDELPARLFEALGWWEDPEVERESSR